MSPTILVVEDEPAILELLRVNLVDAGYDVKAAPDAETAQAMLKNDLPDLVLLDWMLPGMSGLALAKQLRCGLANARAADHHGDRAQRRGRQDRRTRGVGRRLCHQAVFAARVACADQGRAAAGGLRSRRWSRLSAGALDARPDDASGHREREAVHLGPTEFRLLRFFLARPERVHSRSQLQDQVWGDQVYIEERTVDVHIRRLRLALEPFGHGSADRDRARERLPPCLAAMKSVLLKGLIAPLRRRRSRRFSRGAAAGAEWALAVSRDSARSGDHRVAPLSSCALHDWAADSLDAAVPEGRGIWAEPFTALYRRVRVRAAMQRDLRARQSIGSGNAAEALPDGVVLLDAANRIEWANPRALDAARAREAATIAASRSSTWCALPSSCVTSKPATSAIRFSSIRCVSGARWRSSSSRSAWTRSCCCRAT